MEIDITGRHFHVTEALKQHIADKIDKLDKFSLKIEMVHVVLEVQKFRHLSEIVVLAKGLRLTASEASTDMYAAFDKSYGSIQQQLARKHDKTKDHKGRRYKAKAE